VPFVVSDLSSMRSPEDNQIMGIIGENILNKFKVRFDFKNRIATLDKPDLQPQTRSDWVQARQYEGAGIVFDAVIDGAVKVPFLLDTGTVANQLPDKYYRFLNKRQLVFSGQLGSSAHCVKTAKVTFSTFRIGNVVIKKPVFSVKHLDGKNKCEHGCVLHNDAFGVVGPRLFRNTAVTIDYKNMKVQIEKEPKLFGGG
jgi:hypothetical protein